MLTPKKLTEDEEKAHRFADDIVPVIEERLYPVAIGFDDSRHLRSELVAETTRLLGSVSTDCEEKLRKERESYYRLDSDAVGALASRLSGMIRTSIEEFVEDCDESELTADDFAEKLANHLDETIADSTSEIVSDLDAD